MRAWMMSGVAVLATSLTLMGGAAEAASTTLTRWGGWYGRTGGNTCRMGCAPGFVAIGLRVQAGYNYTHMQNMVNEVALICSQVQNDKTLNTELTYEAGSIGGKVFSSSDTLTCARGYALESIYGRSGWGIDRLGIRCRTLDLVYSYIGGSAGAYGTRRKNRRAVALRARVQRGRHAAREPRERACAPGRQRPSSLRLGTPLASAGLGERGPG